MSNTRSSLFLVASWLVVCGCPDSDEPSDAGTVDAGFQDTGPAHDTGTVDSAQPDATFEDAAAPDASPDATIADSGIQQPDATPTDSGTSDTGVEDTGPADIGVEDIGVEDTGVEDTGPADIGVEDTGVEDADPADTGIEDTGVEDTGPLDTGEADTGIVDAGAQVITCDLPLTIDNFNMGTSAAQFPAISYSGDRAVAIWGERVGATTYEGVALAHYNFTTDSWSQPVDIFSESAPGFTPTYDVAIDADGDITALWREVRGGVYSFWVRIYDAVLDTWGTPEEVTPGGFGQIHQYFLEYDRGTGEPMLVFLTGASSRLSVYFTKRGATGWTTPVLLESNDTEHVLELDFTVNDVGQGAVSWVFDIGGTTVTYFVLPYEAGDFRRNISNDLDPLSFVADSEYVSAFPKTALNDNGLGMLVTDDSYASDRELLGVTIDVVNETLGATTPFHTGVSPMSIGLGQVAMSDSGRAAAVWDQRATFGAPSHPWVSIFEAGGWSTPQEVGTYDVGTSGPKIAIDDAGRVTVAWTSGFAGLLATRNTGPGETFLPEQQLTGSVNGSGEVVLAPHASGDFVAVWHEYIDIRAMRCR